MFVWLKTNIKSLKLHADDKFATTIKSFRVYCCCLRLLCNIRVNKYVDIQASVIDTVTWIRRSTQFSTYFSLNSFFFHTCFVNVNIYYTLKSTHKKDSRAAARGRVKRRVSHSHLSLVADL